MYKSFIFLADIVNSLPFLFTIEAISCFFKLGLLCFIIFHGLRLSKLSRPYFFLLIILISSILPDLTWIILLTRKLFLPSIPHPPVLFLIRISWIGFLVEYQSLNFLLQNLIKKNFKIGVTQKISISINALLSIGILYFSIFEFHNTNMRSAMEFNLFKLCSIYAISSIILTMITVIKNAKAIKAPKILKKQVKVLIKGLIIPFVTSDFIQYHPFSFLQNYATSNYAVVSASTILLTLALYFCTKKMMGLRFLNFQNHVQSNISSFNFIKDFKGVLEQLGQVTSVKELNHIVQAFFKEAFGIQPSRVSLYLRRLQPGPWQEEIAPSSVEFSVEQFISHAESSACDIGGYLYQNKILITDEISFNDFYDETALTKELVQFLEQHINADIFLPIYGKQTIIGYIIIEQDARPEELYNNIERDEMVVFASYLANIVNLLQNRNISSMIQKEKELQEELYKKHQEINQYKESIRSFLRDTQQRKIGILFFKNRQFAYGNQAAKDLIQINLSLQEGHPLSKTLYKVSKETQEYKTGQTTITKDTNGNRLVISTIPNTEHNNVIILVYYPEISDIVKEQLDRLHDPSEWDYLLYLETTQSGKLIRQLLPGSHEELLNVKIQLLKLALSKKALLLQVSDDDIMAMVEVLHHVSLRETLHTLILQNPEKNYEYAIKLFGVNKLYNNQQEQSLLEKLSPTGTLFIKNIHFLSLETQQYLAEFIRYGYYRVFKGDQKMVSNVRIMCSTNKNLSAMAQDGSFSKALFNELDKTSFSLPPLLKLPEAVLYDLVDGFTEQALATPTFKTLLELTEKEKIKLINTSPSSLQELRHKVQQMLVKKSKNHNIYPEVQFDPAFNITDPELVEAARLGKKALKDPKTLALLMQKFKNQNQIATFLGVNRSSINRRCKEYNIT